MGCGPMSNARDQRDSRWSPLAHWLASSPLKNAVVAFFNGLLSRWRTLWVTGGKFRHSCDLPRLRVAISPRIAERLCALVNDLLGAVDCLLREGKLLLAIFKHPLPIL